MNLKQNKCYSLNFTRRFASRWILFGVFWADFQLYWWNWHASIFYSSDPQHFRLHGLAAVAAAGGGNDFMHAPAAYTNGATTSATWFPTGHGLVVVCAPGFRDPCFSALWNYWWDSYSSKVSHILSFTTTAIASLFSELRIYSSFTYLFYFILLYSTWVFLTIEKDLGQVILGLLLY